MHRNGDGGVHSTTTNELIFFPDGYHAAPVTPARTDRNPPVDERIVADPRGTRVSSEGHPVEPPPPKGHPLRNAAIVLAVLGALGAGGYFGYPLVREALDTVSTDDAFVEAHITNVAPRIEGLVIGVFVDQNDPVEAGTLLARLDAEPYRIALAQAEATRERQQASYDQTRSEVKSLLAGARAAYFQQRNAREQTRRQVAALRANVADLKLAVANRKLAESTYERYANLAKKGSSTPLELDERTNSLEVAKQRVVEAQEQVQQTRSVLGLKRNEENPLDLPANLEEEQSTVQTSVSDVATSLARVGLDFDLSGMSAEGAEKDLLSLTSSAHLDEAFDRLVDRAPQTRTARARVAEAERDVDEAKLRLSYTEIRSEVAGYVQDRTANPGNRVVVGQTLLSIRPREVWIAANYKETQIHHIRIGMPVDLRVDAYPHRLFKGRVAGFSPGTGLSESLLPPENATGNYVKVTQRLPVRIELTEPNPADTPLFAGLSVVPYVRIKESPIGPDAGTRLRDESGVAPPSLGGGPAGTSPANDARAPAAKDKDSGR